MDVIKTSGLLISKDYYNTIPYIKIKEHLSRRSKSYNTSDYTNHIFYLESDKFLLIPRNFPLNKFLINVNIINQSCEGKFIDIQHNIKPRDPVQKRAINHLMKNDNGIIQLSPGVGKTVITIYMIAERKRKTIILVHRDALVEQWINRIVSFTNLKEKNVGHIKSSNFEEELDKDIILSTVQTFLSLLKRNRGNFLRALKQAQIGIFVGDEVHTTVGAPTFSECSIHIPSKYTYGLSATPYRYDSNSDIITYHLGDIYKDDDDAGTMKCKVTVLLVDYQIDTGGKSKYIRWGGEFQRSRYLSQIKNSSPCIEAIKGITTSLMKDRKVIIITERIKLNDMLYDWIPHESKGKFYGTRNLKELEKDITLTTPGKCRDGIDAPWKDSLIITSPVSNIEQLAGRITRIDKNKKTPSIIDMVDYGCVDIKKTFYNRKQYYIKKNWEINYILCLNNKVSIIDEKTAMEIINGYSEDS